MLCYKTKHSLSILGAFAMGNGTRKSLFTCTILVTEINGPASIFIPTLHGCRTFVLARHEVNIFSLVVFDCPLVQQAVPTNSRKRPTWHPSVRTDFIRLGSVTTNRKNGLTREQLAVGTDSRSVSTGSSQMFSVLTEGCHVGYSREFAGTVYCTYGQSNTANVIRFIMWRHSRRNYTVDGDIPSL